MVSLLQVKTYEILCHTTQPCPWPRGPSTKRKQAFPRLQLVHKHVRPRRHFPDRMKLSFLTRPGSNGDKISQKRRKLQNYIDGNSEKAWGSPVPKIVLCWFVCSPVCL